LPQSRSRLSAGSLEFDVTDLKAVSNVLEAAEPFEILVNDAGTNRPKLMLEVSVEDFDAIMTLNVRSAFFVAQAVVKRLLAARMTGSIVNILSRSSRTLNSGRTSFPGSSSAAWHGRKSHGRGRLSRQRRVGPDDRFVANRRRRPAE